MSDWRKGSRKELTLKSRTKMMLEEKGWRVGDVERRITPIHCADLFGFADLIAFAPAGSGVVAVQVCARSGRAAHVAKYQENATLREWLLDPTREFWMAVWNAKQNGRGLVWHCEIVHWEDLVG